MVFFYSPLSLLRTALAFFKRVPGFLARPFFIMKRWFVGFDATKINLASIWVRSLELPFEFWDEGIIRGIADVISQFISIDVVTKARTSFLYARFCVCIEVGLELPSRVKLLSNLGVWEQILHYEPSRLHHFHSAEISPCCAKLFIRKVPSNVIMKSEMDLVGNSEKALGSSRKEWDLLLECSHFTFNGKELESDGRVHFAKADVSKDSPCKVKQKLADVFESSLTEFEKTCIFHPPSI
ncbi:hypothetical protein SUGI_0221020 [Cryptomeria japonica]|nr:hypothetical protein SUGI_0221020 [Cryptomeria japonica]